MDLKEIRYILTVCETGNMSKAAQQLYVSQPALSKYIKNIEQSQNIKIFERINNRLILTDTGRIYLEAAKNITDIYDRMKLKIKNNDLGLGGHLKLGVTTFRSSHILPVLLPEFCNQYPQIELSLFEESAPALERLLIDGTIDMVIIKMPFLSQNLSYIPLYTEELLLSMPHNHPKSNISIEKEDCKFPWIDIKSMTNETFILLKSGHRTRVITDAILETANIIPKKIIQTDNIETAMNLSAAGLGLSFIPELYTTNYFYSNSPMLFSVGEPKTTSEFVIAYRNERYLSLAVQKFVQIAVEYYQSKK